jgi:hypothetical protein
MCRINAKITRVTLPTRLLLWRQTNFTKCRSGTSVVAKCDDPTFKYDEAIKGCAYGDFCYKADGILHNVHSTTKDEYFTCKNGKSQPTKCSSGSYFSAAEKRCLELNERVDKEDGFSFLSKKQKKSGNSYITCMSKKSEVVTCEHGLWTSSVDETIECKNPDCKDGGVTINSYYENEYLLYPIMATYCSENKVVTDCRNAAKLQLEYTPTDTSNFYTNPKANFYNLELPYVNQFVKVSADGSKPNCQHLDETTLRTVIWLASSGISRRMSRLKSLNILMFEVRL